MGRYVYSAKCPFCKEKNIVRVSARAQRLKSLVPRKRILSRGSYKQMCADMLYVDCGKGTIMFREQDSWLNFSAGNTHEILYGNIRASIEKE